MIRTAACSLIAWALLGVMSCPVQASQSPQTRYAYRLAGREYLDDLARTIRESDRIVVTEHSSVYDFPDYRDGTSRRPDEVVYASRELDLRQRESFLSTIVHLNPKTQKWISLCLEKYHHRIAFYSGGQPNGYMENCFECGQVVWKSPEGAPPESLIAGLTKFIGSVGLSPKRDWEALAKEHLRASPKSLP